jgi:hypothetical protein
MQSHAISCNLSRSHLIHSESAKERKSCTRVLKLVVFFESESFMIKLNNDVSVIAFGAFICVADCHALPRGIVRVLQRDVNLI